MKVEPIADVLFLQQQLSNRITELSGKLSNLETRFNHYKDLTNPIIAGLQKDLDALKHPVIEVKWKGVT